MKTMHESTDPPPGWQEALARGEADLARGDTVLAEVVLEELRAHTEELEAELAQGAGRRETLKYR